MYSHNCGNPVNIGFLVAYWLQTRCRVPTHGRKPIQKSVFGMEFKPYCIPP